MIIHQPEIQHLEDKIVVSARVETSQSVPGLPEKLWFSYPEQYTAWVSARSDGFASSLLQLAMYIEEDLEVRGSISPRLAYGLQEYQQVFHSWFPTQFAKINLCFDRLEVTQPHPNDQAVVTAFSGGVDSFYTLWCHLPENQPIPDARISHGLYVHGFDVPLTNVAFYGKTTDQYIALFQRLGMSLLTASTNANAFWKYRLRWEYVNGGSLIGIAQVMTGLVCRYYVPSTLHYTDHTPLGTNPLVDHLLSTETMEVIHFGGDRERIEKLAAINSWEEARRLLRVCTDIPDQDGIINCSRCIKCKYTYTMLDALGTAENFPSIKKGYSYWDIFRWGFIPIRPVYFKQMMSQALKHLRFDIFLPLPFALLVGSVRSALYWKVINHIPKTTLYRLKHTLFAPKQK